MTRIPPKPWWIPLLLWPVLVTVASADESPITQRQAEHWAWPLVRDEPAHLLDPRHAGWRDFKLAVLRELLREVLAVDSPRELGERRWGDLNTVSVRHPLSGALPLLPRWLDMPAAGLPGDILMPRVQAGALAPRRALP